MAVITFGPHGVTGHPDHIVVGSATRWAVERLADVGHRTELGLRHLPVFDPAESLRPLAGGADGDASHRDHGLADASSPPSSATPARPTRRARSPLRAAIESGVPIYEGYQRVRPIVPAPHPAFDTALL